MRVNVLCRVAHRESFWLAAVIALGLAARLLVFAEIREGPALWLHTWSESDMHFFDRWAQAVAAGDLLTRQDMRPYHSRHRALACASLAQAGRGTVACDDAAVRSVWDSWVGTQTFWQDPLYPYALGSLYRIFGRSPYVRYAANVVLGLASIAMIWSIAGALAGPMAANLAGGVAALYGPLLFFETLLLRETMIVLAALTTVRLLMAVVERPERRWTAFTAGIAAGAAVLLKSSAALFVPAALALIGFGRNQRRWRMLALVCFVAGFGIALLPLVARNLTLGLPPFALAVSGPLNFLNGNAADRVDGAGSNVSAYAAPILSRTGGDSLAVIVATIRTHPSPWSWLQLLWRKLIVFWRCYEIPNNANYAYFRLQAPLASKLLVTWPWILPLALLGAFHVATRPAGWVLLTHVAVGIVTCVIFYNLSRFRLPVAACLLALTGPGAAALAGLWRQGAVRRSAAAVALAVALTLIVSQPWVRMQPEIRLADYGVANEISEHLIRMQLTAGRLSTATRLVERQLRTEPRELMALEPSAEPSVVTVELAGLAGTFVVLHDMASDLYTRTQRPDQAAYHARRAAILRRIHAPYLSAVSPE